ncbi:inner membrane protein [Escherichia coli]|nr:inner membrane protein [Escherichia coli]
MLRIFIPTSNGKISRRRYIFSFILINFIFAFLIIFFNDGEAGFLVIVSTIVLHYLVIGNDSNLLIVFYVQIMPDDFVMQLHRF